MRIVNPVEALVDYYLYPKLPTRKHEICPTYNIGGTECLLVTRSDASCWVFYCHGNAVTLSDLYTSKVAQNIAEHCKCNFVAPAYPSSAQTGTAYDNEVIASVQAAYKRLKSDQSQPVFVVGRSLGVGVALQMQEASKPAGIACISGFESVHSLLPCSPMRCVVSDRYNNSKAIAAASLDGVPKLIIHGDNDVLIPFQHAERLHAAAQHAVLHVIPGMDHCPNDAQWQQIYSQLAHFVTTTSAQGVVESVLYPLWKC